MGIADEVTRLKSENMRLKWLIGQMMQRWSKDGFALFRMDNPVQFGIMVKEDSVKRLLEVRTKRLEPTDDAPDTDGQSGLN